MIISYNWLCEYLPEIIEPEKLSRILTSIGLEVESLHKYESVKGGLQGLVIGEVLTCEKHPDADKLKLTNVNIGAAALHPPADPASASDAGARGIRGYSKRSKQI